MNIQIFGTSKCFDTKKAQRYFKERGIKFPDDRPQAKRDEPRRVRERGPRSWRLGKAGGPNAKDKQTLALLDALVDWQKEDKLFENQQLLFNAHCTQWPQGHRGLPARCVEDMGIRNALFTKKPRA